MIKIKELEIIKYVCQILGVVAIILLLLMSVMGIGLSILSYLSEFWAGMIIGGYQGVMSLMMAIDISYTYSSAIDKG